MAYIKWGLHTWQYLTIDTTKTNWVVGLMHAALHVQTILQNVMSIILNHNVRWTTLSGIDIVAVKKSIDAMTKKRNSDVFSLFSLKWTTKTNRFPGIPVKQAITNITTVGICMSWYVAIACCVAKSLVLFRSVLIEHCRVEGESDWLICEQKC